MNIEINQGKAEKSGYIPSSKEREPCKLGISLEFIVSWVKEQAISDCLATKEVCEFIKQATQGTQLSFCELLLTSKNTAKFVGSPSVFISHSWKEPFLKVVEALTSYFASEEDVMIWFDVFSCNQHTAPSLKSAWWRDTLKDVIHLVGRTVMVLTSWNDPLPLQSAWCVWELYCTIEGKSKFDVAMCPDSIEQLTADAEADRSCVNKFLGAIDSSKSECSEPDDTEKIHEHIQAGLGFDELNKKIFEIMRDCISIYAENTQSLRDFGTEHKKELWDTLFMKDSAVLYSILGEYASMLYHLMKI